MKKIAFVLGMVFLVMPLTVKAEDVASFKTYNPDGLKYEFARSYIASLGYLNNVEERWKKSAEVKKGNSEEKYIAWNIERLIYDNMDVRVAKNYVAKYFTTHNLLMRKVTDSYIFACDQLVEINRKERELWEKAKELKESKEFDSTSEKTFLKEQEQLAARRQEAMRGIVSSSVLMTKVLLSENTREKDVKKRLAISSQEREKLVDKLDSYAKDNLDWNLKPGQTYVQAAEASVREVLEDSFYLSVDEK